MSKDEQTAASALVQLRRKLDDHFTAAVARTPAAFACRAGCSQCCHTRFSVFAAEAEPIRAALLQLARNDPAARERIRSQARESSSVCPLLLDDTCSVYEARPLICRSHGLPVTWREDGEQKLDVCQLNFREQPPPRESILSLDVLNAPLSVIARMFDPAGDRIELTALAGED